MQQKGLPVFKLSLANSIRDEATSGYCTKWRKKIKINGEDKYIWIKLGANTWGGYDHQSFAEVAVSYLVKDLGLDKHFLMYKPCICEFTDEAEMRTERVLGCYSFEMIDPDEEEIIPLSHLAVDFNINTINCITKEEALLKQYTEFIDRVCSATGIDKDKFKEYVDMTILIDELVMNTDRRLGNLAVIKNIYTGKYRIAPIFDTGQSFLLFNDQWDEGGEWSDGQLDNVFSKNFLDRSNMIRHDELLIVTKYFCTPEGIKEREQLAQKNFNKTIKVIKTIYESVGFGIDESWTQEDRRRVEQLRHGRIDNPILLPERNFMLNMLKGRKRTVLDGYKPTIVPANPQGFDKTTFEIYYTGKFKD